MIIYTSPVARKLYYSIILVFFTILLGACNTSSKSTYEKFDSNNNLIEKGDTKTSENAMVMQAMAPAIAACRKIVKGRKQAPQQAVLYLTPEEVLGLKADAQAKYIDRNFMLGILQNSTRQTEILAKALGREEITCERAVVMAVESYMEKEKVQAKQWGKVGITTAIAIPVATVLTTAMGIMNTALAGQGDTISTGDINVTKSDDPSIGGESSGGTGGIGGQSITIGSGQSATDQAQTAKRIDKNLTTPIRGSSNLDGSGSPSGAIIDDKNDGSNNSARLLK